VPICRVCQFPNRPAAVVVLTEYPLHFEPTFMAPAGGPVVSGPDIFVCTRCIGQTINVLGAAGVIVGSVAQLPTDGSETPSIPSAAG